MLFAWLLGCLSPSEPGAFVPRTVAEDDSLPRIAIEVAGRERKIHLETFGDPGAPALFFLHGSNGDYRNLRAFSALADRFFVVMWDQRGGGLSERIDEREIGFDAWVEEIDVLKARFAPDAPIAIVGYSWGAAYATMYTGRRPDAVRELVLIEPGPLTGEIMGAAFDALVDLDLTEDTLTDVAWQNEFLTPSDHARLDHRAILLLETSQVRFHCDPDDPPPQPFWRIGAHVQHVRSGLVTDGANYVFDFTTGVERFAGDVTIVGSACSAIGDDFQRRYHAGIFANTSFVRVEDAGHRLMSEREDEVLRVLRDAL